MTNTLGTPIAEPNEPEKKLCRECGETIPPQARKCGRCDAYQDWRRMLLFGNTTLSLLVALISVLTVALPIMKSTFMTRRERVTARVVSQRYEESLASQAIIILLANAGTASAFVDPTAAIKVHNRAGTKVFGVNLLSSRRLRGPDSTQGGVAVSDLLLEPSVQRVFFANVPEKTPTLADPSPDSDCELSVSVLTLNGRKREEKHRYRCYDWGALDEEGD